MNWLIHLMRRKPEAREAELLADAKMALIEHEAAAEHHDALATMLRHRIERLSETDQQRVERAHALARSSGYVGEVTVR